MGNASQQERCIFMRADLTRGAAMFCPRSERETLETGLAPETTLPSIIRCDECVEIELLEQRSRQLHAEWKQMQLLKGRSRPGKAESIAVSVVSSSSRTIADCHERALDRGSPEPIDTHKSYKQIRRETPRTLILTAHFNP